MAAGAPPIIERGEGIYLIDSEGRRFIDAISSWWCVALGHSHPRLVAAIQRQAAILQHSILANLTHPAAAELAYRLARLMPSPDRRVLFASDGASAVEQALKIAVQYWWNEGRPQKNRFACLRRAYHGDTIGAMGVGYLEDWHRPFRPLLASAIQLPLPSETDDFALWQERLDPSAHELAAAIVEPLCLGAAGMRMYAPEWLARLADWCTANDVLLIVDEIAMGFGRTGKWFAFEHAGIDPDIVCVGKALTGGALPMSATIARESIYETFSDGPVDRTLQHGHTFCGNPIAAAAALEALSLYEELNAPALAREKGRRLAQQLEPLAALEGILDVRSLGLIAAVELTPSVDGGRDRPTRPQRIRQRLFERGILLRPLGHVVYLMPPLIITEAELDYLAQETARAIRDVVAGEET